MGLCHKICVIVVMLCSMAISSCNVHEFPGPMAGKVPFVLHLDYETDLPLHKIVDYQEATRSGGEDIYNIRYVVNVYPDDEDSREVLCQFVFTEEDLNNLDNEVTMILNKGRYKFIVWTDYVSASEKTDTHYSTSDFSAIYINGEEHPGCNDYRDAFCGTVISEVSDQVLEATVQMERPMAKFNFISNDLGLFMERIKIQQISKAEEIDISDYRVLLRYHGFMPNAFNMYTDKPSDASTGVVFSSELKRISDDEVEMGFDYVFVNGNESAVTVSLEIYDEEGEKLSEFVAVDIPIVRSKLTTVKGAFLTTETNGGVSVLPDYDGEFIYKVE